MTDTQLVTIVIAILASIGALFYNNSRISDLRADIGKHIDSLNKRLDDVNRHIEERFDDVNRHIENKYQLLDRKLDRILDTSASHEERIYKLEHPNASK